MGVPGPKQMNSKEMDNLILFEGLAKDEQRQVFMWANLHCQLKPTPRLKAEFENHGHVLGAKGWTKGGFCECDQLCLSGRLSVFILKGS